MQRLRHIFNAFSNPPPSDNLYLTFRINNNPETHSLPLFQTSDCYFIKGEHLSKIKLNSKNTNLKWYDASLGNTMCARSQICFIDGEKSILAYRGYSIEKLAEKSTFLETAFLLIYGELPDKTQLEQFTRNVMDNSLLPTDMSDMIKHFRYDSHPMGIIISIISAFSAQKTIIEDISNLNNPKARNKAIYMLLGMLPTLAANSYRHRIGRAQNLPNKDLGYIENFLYMLDRLNEKDYISHPKLVKAFQMLFIIHAEHEVNCSTALLRHLISTGTNIFSAISAAAGALYGPRHGGANSSVIQMLEQIGTIGNINKFLLQVKQKKRILYGFGHRVYKNKDPRALIAKKIALDVFQVCGKEPLIDLALEIQKIAAQDQFFITRRIFPNVDFYNGLIYRAMGIPTDMYPVLFALPLLAGWLAHWIQCLSNDENACEPSQLYVGRGTRGFIQMNERKENLFEIDAMTGQTNRRRTANKMYLEEQKKSS